MSIKESVSTFKDNFMRDYKRISKIGTWDSLSDAAVFISVTILIVTTILDIIFYVSFCSILDFPILMHLGHVDSKQLFLFLAVIFHILFTTFAITSVSVKLYDQVISKPVKQLVLQMRNINRGEMTDYLLSGKLSKPFTSSGNDETWLDIVQGYVDLASSEKYIDELTGCFNRKYFSQVLDGHMKNSLMFDRRNTSAPMTYNTDLYAVFLIDIDFFKRVNDDFGHAAGDEVLKAVGNTLRNLFANEGVVIRNGGEEFLVVTCAKYPHDFSKTAESINKAFREHIRIKSPSTDEVRNVTCSVGFVTYPFFDGAHNLSLQNHVDLADQAMYLSKLDGRDQWHELVSNKVPPVGFDLYKLCSDMQYGVDNGYISVRSNKR